MTVYQIISAIRDSGTDGLSSKEIGLILLGRPLSSEADRWKVRNVLSSARLALARNDEMLHSSKPRGVGTKYYIETAQGVSTPAIAVRCEPIAPVALSVPSTRTSIPSVLRRVSGDLGIGGTPGAMVSVARVSCLDGAAL